MILSPFAWYLSSPYRYYTSPSYRTSVEVNIFVWKRVFHHVSHASQTLCMTLSQLPVTTRTFIYPQIPIKNLYIQLDFYIWHIFHDTSLHRSTDLHASPHPLHPTHLITLHNHTTPLPSTHSKHTLLSATPPNTLPYLPVHHTLHITLHDTIPFITSHTPR